ncbi:MAG: J domain-containing protein [Rhodospirillaceae bacterium]
MVDQHNINDSKGYYLALGVQSDASSEQIRVAFRRKAKNIHPDHNPGVRASNDFQLLNEAHHVLSDVDARARYDALIPERSVSPPSVMAPGVWTHTPPAPVEPITCSHCGTISAQPRYAIYWRVIGFGLGTLRQPVRGVFCRSCADGQALRASAVTLLLGWWGLPWGPVWTIKALWSNMLGGRQPADLNTNLLRHQLHYFMSVGNYALARASLGQALRLVKRPEQRQQLLNIEAGFGNLGRDRLINRWRPASSPSFYLHLSALILVAIAVAIVFGMAAHVGFSYLRTHSKAPVPVQRLSL